MRTLKLIWDIKGPDAELTAQHHLTHLREYIKEHKVEVVASGVEHMNGVHHICFTAVKEKDMPQMRDDLKPHRAQLWQEKS
ncbi:hypothetical protein [Nonlabens marinus]|uniref:Uncharacterized protein n=1 Tax=Nonlabens marinus S1-08 TaxID=1454201 RepID=W8VNX7_9FLAO|nr:hypothetical protein [Nonlabens marinus]BAO54145.1 hypothetical protein NMS_0136 [Nonlabens marinus S1-08]